MILHIDAEDQRIIIQALNVLIEEYGALANTASSKVLSIGFRNDITRMTVLLGEVENTVKTETDEELRQSVLTLIRKNFFINAIKHVRTQRGLNLKDAKDYVDKLRNA